MITIRIADREDLLHVSVERWTHQGRYAVSLLDFDMDALPGESELAMLCRASQLLRQAALIRRYEE